jgi:hypothetical protein
MGLEVLFNKTENLHENVQFRRVANGLKKLFVSQGWDGILLGNPSNDDYYRFRADGILLYNNGVIIIDFKDYAGEIIFPSNDEDFEKDRWYINTIEGERIKIEGGANFPNPFRQLKAYRQVMYDIVNDDRLMKYVIDPSRVCALNIFSGPITLNRRTSRKVPYYQLIQESDLHTFLYDFTSKNAYEKPIAEKFKLLFPADQWQEDIVIEIETKDNVDEPRFIDGELEPVLKEFFGTEEPGVLILESKDILLRDQWAKMVNTYVLDNLGVETHLWSHSTRIAGKIFKRSRLITQSLYTAIYGGSQKPITVDDATDEQEEISQDIVAIRDDSNIDVNDVFIIADAHLVSGSLNQSDLIRFGSGRLLNDLFTFLRFKTTQRKLILIGDPYMLSYGGVEDSALNIKAINELFEDGNIITYRNNEDEDSPDTNLYNTRKSLASCIDQKVFNRLQYTYDESIEEVEQNGVRALLTKWFNQPLVDEPKNAVLFFSKKDARKTNFWIKSNILNNGRALAKDDLLLVNNNINIPDDTGFGHPTKIMNGSYLRILESREEEAKEIKFEKGKNSVILNYRNLKVELLSDSRKPILSILILENYLHNEENLDREEQIALRVFISQKVAELKKKFLFEDSIQFQNLQSDKNYKGVISELEILEQKELKGEKVLKKDLKTLTTKRNKLERSYKRDYTSSLTTHLRKSDPYINAAYVNYGWAITVHKSVGSQFDNILFKVLQSNDAGITNEGYFRWLYSGLTSVLNKAIIIHPQLINPFKECVFVDEIEISKNPQVIEVKPLLELAEIEISSDLQNLVNEDFNHNSLAAIELINRQLESFKIESVNKFTDYLSKVVLKQVDGDFVTIAISNRGNYKLSVIKVESCPVEIEDVIQKAVNSLYPQDMHTSFPNDFRGEIYRDWESKLLKENITIKLKEQYPNEDRLLLSDDNNILKFNLRYTTAKNIKGLFTSLTITEKTDQSLVSTLENLLNNG